MNWRWSSDVGHDDRQRHEHGRGGDDGLVGDALGSREER